MKNLALIALSLFVLAATGLNYVTTRVNVEELRAAQYAADAQMKNNIITQNMVAYAAKVQVYANTFGEAASREQERAERAERYAQFITKQAQAYIGLCRKKLDDAKIPHPTMDELEAVMNPQPTAAEPTTGEPTPAEAPKE